MSKYSKLFDTNYEISKIQSLSSDDYKKIEEWISQNPPKHNEHTYKYHRRFVDNIMDSINDLNLDNSDYLNIISIKDDNDFQSTVESITGMHVKHYYTYYQHFNGKTVINKKMLVKSVYI